MKKSPSSDVLVFQGRGSNGVSKLGDQKFTVVSQPKIAPRHFGGYMV